MSNVVPFLSGPKPTLLPEEEVTISRLSAILEAAFMDFEIDESGDIFVTDGLEYPLWLTIDAAGKFLHLFTYREIEEEPEADWLSRINRMNETLIVTRFYRMDDAIWGDYSMSFEGGLNVRQFVKMLRRFSGGFVADLRLHKDSPPESLLAT
jgi:hypothetical protein